MIKFGYFFFSCIKICANIFEYAQEFWQGNMALYSQQLNNEFLELDKRKERKEFL